MPLLSGTKLGPYEIVDAVGAGGMGEVCRARDSRLDRTVAIKILASSDHALRQRFEREARTISKFSHPNNYMTSAITKALNTWSWNISRVRR